MTQKKLRGSQPQKSSDEKVKEILDKLYEKYSPTDAARLIEHFKRRDETKPPKTKVGSNNNALIFDCELEHAKFVEAMGTFDADLAMTMIDQSIKTSAYPATSAAERANVAISLLNGIKPKDELEGMIAIQLIGLHNLSMSFMANAIYSEQTFEGRDAYISRATKCIRAFTGLVEALARYRAKGQQKVVVKHVHVNEGGKAIVGDVTQVRGEGGKHEKCG